MDITAAAVWYAFGLTLFAGLATGLGSALAFVARQTNTKFLSIVLGFSAGVMVYVSFVEIFAEARHSLAEALGEAGGSWAAAAAFFGGIFLTLATHGSDHDLVQRVLTCRNREDCVRSLLYSGWVALACGLMFLLVGSVLWLSAQHGLFVAEEGVSPILTYLKKDASPVMRGVFVAAILAAAMSTLSSAFSASTATLSNDLLPQNWRDTLGKNRLIMLSLCVVVWLLALGTNAFKNANPEVKLLEIALSSLTLVYGALLAFFVTALFTQSRPTPARCTFGAFCGVVTGVTLFAQSSLAFEWLVVAGLLVTFTVLNVASPREVRS